LFFIVQVVHAQSDNDEEQDPNARDDCKVRGNNHGDVDPSEKRFKQYWDKDICQLADCIDKELCEGKITGEKEFEKYQQSTAWKSGDAEMKGCQLVRFEDFPNDKGQSELADYEIQKCAQDAEGYI
jgi:hypothetical protein